MNDAVPAGKKQSREAMIKVALTYPEGLRVGNFTDGKTPFAPETYRVENGVITAGDGCGRPDCGMYSQNIIVHPGVIASVAAVDEEQGVVLLWMNFGHTGSAYGEGNLARHLRSLQGVGRADSLDQCILQGTADLDGTVLAFF